MRAYENQAKTFKILMHPTRLAILDVLRDGEQCVCHMEAIFGLRQAYISQHLMVLRDAGLVTDRRDGWNIYYHVSKPEIYAVIDAMNGIVGGGNRSQKKVTSKADCPCPKCNPGAGQAKWETTEPADTKTEPAS
jgi:ArsR family transcriptional regulator